MGNRILLVTTKYTVFGQPLRRAFESLGCQVRSVDYWGNVVLMPGTYMHRATAKLPRRLGNLIIALAQRHIDRRILSEARDFKPDLIFVIKAKGIREETLKKLRAIAKTANYYPETFDHWETLKRIASQFDFLFNYDAEVVRRLYEEGFRRVHYIPFSADIEKNKPSPDFSGRKYAITFVGSFMPVRYSQRETILSRIKDLGLHVWGNKAWLSTELKDYYRGRPTDEEMLQIYQNSKIVVNIDLMAGVPGTGVNLRPFEITSAGALLMNHDDRKDIFNLFENGKEFIAFCGPDDIRSKVIYYLDHEEERMKVAAAGFERTQRTHTYIDSAKAMLSIINHG